MIEDIINMIFNGTLNGAVLSLIALGYSLVYGVGHIMNLAHGAYFMLTGYLLLWGLRIFPGLLFLNVIFVVAIVTIIGGLTYILLIKPLQDSQVGVVLITFGLAFAIEQIVLINFGTDSVSISKYLIFDSTTEILGFPMADQSIFFIVMSLAIVLIFALFISKSKLGKSIRAVSQDREAAVLMGINANRTLFYTVVISALLASVAGSLYLPGAALTGPSMGWSYLTAL